MSEEEDIVSKESSRQSFPIDISSSVRKLALASLSDSSTLNDPFEVNVNNHCKTDTGS